MLGCLLDLASLAKSLGVTPTLDDAVRASKRDNRRSVQVSAAAGRPMSVADASAPSLAPPGGERKKKRQSAVPSARSKNRRSVALHAMAEGVPVPAPRHKSKSHHRTASHGKSPKSPRKDQGVKSPRRKSPPRAKPAKENKDKAASSFQKASGLNPADVAALIDSDGADSEDEDDYVYADEVEVDEKGAIVVPAPDKNWQDKRTAAIGALVEAERAFVARLRVFDELLMQPLWKHAIVSKADLAVIFGNLELLLSLSESFLDALVECEEKGGDIGPIFNDRIEQVRLYVQYARNYERSLDAIERSRGKHGFRAFLETAERKEELKGMTMEDCLLDPIEHCTRYVMLVDEVFVHTPESHPDFGALDEAFDNLDQVAVLVNEVMTKGFNLQTLLDVEKVIAGLELPGGKAEKLHQGAAHGRVFIRRGGVVKISGGKRQERHMFLFNDLLIYTKPKTVLFRKRFQTRGVLKLSEVLLRDVDDKAFEVVRLDDKKKVYGIVCKSTDEKNLWWSDLQHLITEHLRISAENHPEGAAPSVRARGHLKRSGSAGALNKIM